MPERHHYSTLHGQRPGSPDLPGRDVAREVKDEQQRKERRRAQEARAANRANGRLDLAQFDDRMTHAAQLIPPPGGRPRKVR